MCSGSFCEFGSILYCTHIIDGFHGNWDVIVQDTKYQLFSFGYEISAFGYVCAPLFSFLDIILQNMLVSVY